MDSYTEIRNKIRAMTGQKTPLLLTGKVKVLDERGLKGINVPGTNCSSSRTVIENLIGFSIFFDFLL